VITYKQIKKAINDELKRQFSLDINSNDVKEGFQRPSFSVVFDNINRSSTMDQVEKSLTIQIFYFPEDQYDYSMEILDVQEQLEEVFDLKLSVLDRKFNIIEATSTVIDGVLEFSFDIQFFDAKDISNSNPLTDANGNPIEVEVMRTLDLRKGDL